MRSPEYVRSIQLRDVRTLRIGQRGDQHLEPVGAAQRLARAGFLSGLTLRLRRLEHEVDRDEAKELYWWTFTLDFIGCCKAVGLQPKTISHQVRRTVKSLAKRRGWWTPHWRSCWADAMGQTPPPEPGGGEGGVVG